MNRIWVMVAGEGRRVPIEGRRAAYFEPGKKHHVPNTPFIQRRIAEGDLKETDAPTDLGGDVERAEAAIVPPVAEQEEH